MTLKPWQYLEKYSDAYYDNYDESWAEVTAQDLSFEVFYDEEVSDCPCVCLSFLAYPSWDQSMPESLLERFLPGAEVFEFQEAMFEVENMLPKQIEYTLTKAGLTKVSGLNPYV